MEFKYLQHLRFPIFHLTMFLLLLLTHLIYAGITGKISGKLENLYWGQMLLLKVQPWGQRQMLKGTTL